MKEKNKQPNENLGGTGGDDMFNQPSDTPQTVIVGSGPYVEHLPVAGMSVSAIRKKFKDRLDIDPASTAVVNGNDVNDDVIVGPGETLNFMHRSGEKG